MGAMGLSNMADLFNDRGFRAGLLAGIAVLLVLGTVALLSKAWVLVQPLIVAAFLSAALWPWVSRISSRPIGRARWRPPRFLAAGLIYSVALGSTILVVWMMLQGLIPQLGRLLAAYPQQTAFIQEYLEPFRAGDIAGGAARVAEDVAREASGDAGPPGAAATTVAAVSVGALAIGLFGGLTTLALVLVFTFFLLLEGDRLAQWILLMLPKGRRAGARVLALEIRDRISRWVLAQFTYAAVSFGLMTAGMFAIGIPSPWVYGIFSAFLALLPGIGPAAAAIPAFFVAMDLSSWQAIAVAGFAAAVYAMDGTFLVPRIYGSVMDLPVFVVLLGTLLGFELMGVWGAMIAAPAAVTVQIVLRSLFRPPRANGGQGG